MKRFLTVFVAVLFVAGAVFAQVDVNGSKGITVAKEYLWNTTPPLGQTFHIKNINYHLERGFNNNDYLKFWLPAGWTWGTTASTKWYLFVKTAGGGVSKNTANFAVPGDTDNWTQNKKLADLVEFRVQDSTSPSYMAFCTTWYLSTVANAVGDPQTWTVPVYIVDPCETLTDVNFCSTISPKSYLLYAKTSDQDPNYISNAVESSHKMLTVYYQFYTRINGGSGPVTEYINVNDNRMTFVPHYGSQPIQLAYPLGGPAVPNFESSWANYAIGNCFASLDYFIIPAAADTFRLTLATTDWTGVKVVAGLDNDGIRWGTYKGDISDGIINIPGSVIDSNALVTKELAIDVTGTTPMYPRTFNATVAWIPNGANGCGTTLADYNGTTGPRTTHIWDINAQMFRVAFFGTADLLGRYTSIRFANDTDTSARVFADVYMDDITMVPRTVLGIPVKGTVTIGSTPPVTVTYPDEIPARTAQSYSMAAILDLALIPYSHDDHEKSKGYAIFFVQSGQPFNAFGAPLGVVSPLAQKATGVFGEAFYQNHLMYTQFTLEQLEMVSLLGLHPISFIWKK